MSDPHLASISATMMSSLPESTLLEAMDQVPLDELYKSDRECPRWRSLKPIALSRRLSVTLVVGPQNAGLFGPLGLITQSCFNIPHLTDLDLSSGIYPTTPELDFRTVHNSVIRMVRLTQDEAVRLATTFPQVLNLRVVISQLDDEESSMPQVTFLLTQWKTTLVTLKLWYSDNQTRGQDVSFLSALNSLAELQHLTLETPGLQLASHSDYFTRMLEPVPQEEPIAFPQVDLQVLAGLKELHLATLDHANCMVDSIKRCTNGCDIRLVVMASPVFHEFPDAYETVPQAVLSRIGTITSANTLNPMIVDHKFGIVCALFDGLTSLTIGIGQTISMVQLVDQMASLSKSLIYLHVTFNKKDPSFGKVNVSQGPLNQLHSVKILSLECETLTNSHTDLAPLRIAEVFPNLEVVKVVDEWLYGFECEHQCQSMFKPEPIKYCVQRQLHSLSQCASLKTIFYGDNAERYERNEIFPEPSAEEGSNMAGMNMANLSYELVMEKFGRLPLEKLFILNQVCTRWYHLRDRELQRREDVTLLVDPIESLQRPVLASRFNHNLTKISHNTLRCLWLTHKGTH